MQVGGGSPEETGRLGWGSCRCPHQASDNNTALRAPRRRPRASNPSRHKRRNQRRRGSSRPSMPPPKPAVRRTALRVPTSLATPPSVSYTPRTPLDLGASPRGYTVPSTTCATVLTKVIFTEGCKSVTAGTRATDLKRGISMAVDSVVTNLKGMARMINISEEIAHVGTISANGEREIGELIAKAMEKVDQ